MFFWYLISQRHPIREDKTPQLAQSKTGKIDTSSSFVRFESAFAHTVIYFHPIPSLRGGVV